MRLTHKASLFFALLALLGPASLQPVQAQVYNAANDFEAGYLAHQNPNGVWEYGWTQGLPSINSPLHLFTTTGLPGSDSPDEQAWTDPSISISPILFYNPTAINNGNINAPAHTLFGSGSVYNGVGADANIVFVAPTSGTYGLSATFQGVQNSDNADIHILANSVSLLSSTITQVGQTASYSGNVFLAQGQTIDFAFGLNNNFTEHPANVALFATVTASPVPEASSIISLGLLLLLGLGGVVVSRQRRAGAAR